MQGYTLPQVAPAPTEKVMLPMDIAKDYAAPIGAGLVSAASDVSRAQFYTDHRDSDGAVIAGRQNGDRITKDFIGKFGDDVLKPNADGITPLDQYKEDLSRAFNSAQETLSTPGAKGLYNHKVASTVESLVDAAERHVNQEQGVALQRNTSQSTTLGVQTATLNPQAEIENNGQLKATLSTGGLLLDHLGIHDPVARTAQLLPNTAPIIQAAAVNGIQAGMDRTQVIKYLADNSTYMDGKTYRDTVAFVNAYVDDGVGRKNAAALVAEYQAAHPIDPKNPDSNGGLPSRTELQKMLDDKAQSEGWSDAVTKATEGRLDYLHNQWSNQNTADITKNKNIVLATYDKNGTAAAKATLAFQSLPGVQQNELIDYWNNKAKAAANEPPSWQQTQAYLALLGQRSTYTMSNDALAAMRTKLGDQLTVKLQQEVIQANSSKGSGVPPEAKYLVDRAQVEKYLMATPESGYAKAPKGTGPGSQGAIVDQWILHLKEQQDANPMEQRSITNNEKYLDQLRKLLPSGAEPSSWYNPFSWGNGPTQIPLGNALSSVQVPEGYKRYSFAQQKLLWEGAEGIKKRRDPNYKEQDWPGPSDFVTVQSFQQDKIGGRLRADGTPDPSKMLVLNIDAGGK